MDLEWLKEIGTTLGVVIFVLAVTMKTFCTKFNEYMRNSKESISRNIKAQSSIDCEIVNEMEKIKDILEADRVQIYDFHNGLHYANGRSASKLTCTYEVCRYGVKSALNFLSGIPISCLPTFVKTLLDNGKLFVDDLEQLKNTMPATYNFKKSMDITSFYDMVFYDKNHEPVGFIAIQFCDGKKHKINAEVIQKFAWFVESKLLESLELEKPDKKKK